MNRIFYHRMDLDGHAAGAIARRALEVSGEKVRLYPYDYADHFPEREIEKGDTVWFIDVAWQPFENMPRLGRERGCRVVLIDHHRSVAESGVLDALESHFSLDNSRGGCLLAWEYLMRGRVAPEWVQLLSRYDVWDDHDAGVWRGRIVPFQMGMQALKTDPAENWRFWLGLFSRDKGSAGEFVRDRIRDGRAILAYVEARNARAAADHAFEARLDGLRALCVNSTFFASAALEPVWDPSRHDLMLIYARRRDGHWRVALFTAKPGVDVSRVASGYGGGGHRTAAGFTARSVSVRGGKLAVDPLVRRASRRSPRPGERN
jgi:oligoribonuclease NrnB/cAMP/cGMP phosphodiesterase (DHH superfamily)